MFSSNCIVKKYARNRKRAACMFFSVCKDRFHLTRVSPRYDGSDDRAHSARGHPNRRITKITRNVNVPLYDGLDDRAHCAHGHPNRRIVFF